jgi:hypothetical protein
MKTIERFERFVSVMDALLVGNGYVVQIVHAFFDESGSHKGSPALCVAGYAFEMRQARLLAKEWQAVLKRFDLPFFHMVDCAHGNQECASLTKDQRIKLATSLIGIVKSRAAHGFAVSVDVDAFHEVMPPWAPAKTPYAFCARCVIDEIGRWFFKTGFKRKSAYFFEAGHESRSEAERAVGEVLTNPLNKIWSVHYGYVAHSFVLKRESPAVQAADLLAWQWATELKHRKSGRPRRKDFESLVQAPHRGVHFDTNRLLGYVEILKEFGLADNRESATLMEEVERVMYVRDRAVPSMFR